MVTEGPEGLSHHPPTPPNPQLADYARFDLLQDVAPLSLVRLHPHTGLKHQLRVHMARVLGGTFFLDFLARSSLLGFVYCRPVSYVFLLSFFFFRSAYSR